LLPVPETEKSSSAATKISSTPSTNDNPSAPTSAESSVWPAVLSIGYNPFYANKTRSIEIHILQPPLSHSHQSSPQAQSPLPEDFYGAPLNLLVLGFIRPEYDYVSKDALIEDINVDCQVARRSLEREKYRGHEGEEWLRDFRWADKK
jgi:riboflavin kinase